MGGRRGGLVAGGRGGEGGGDKDEDEGGRRHLRFVCLPDRTRAAAVSPAPWPFHQHSTPRQPQTPPPLFPARSAGRTGDRYAARHAEVHLGQLFPCQVGSDVDPPL